MTNPIIYGVDDLREDDQLQFFNRFERESIAYNNQEVDAVIGYFLKRGFEKTAAVNVALTILQQSSRDSTPVFSIIDTLKGVDNVVLSDIVARILNINRPPTSLVGLKTARQINAYERRNILI
jgi:hypothetical protein